MHNDIMKAIEIEYHQAGELRSVYCHNTVAEMGSCMHYLKSQSDLDSKDLTVRDVGVTESQFLQKAWNREALTSKWNLPESILKKSS